MAGANVRRWGPASPEPRPLRKGQVSTLGCSPLEAGHRAMQSSLCGLHSIRPARRHLAAFTRTIGMVRSNTLFIHSLL